MLLLREFSGHASAVLDATPGDVFGALTDIDRLPEWNKRIEKVLEPPVRALAPGVEWIVKMFVPPASWASRARVTVYDPQRWTFEHISQSDDGNPSYGAWKWMVTATEHGARVDVEWSVHPKTFWRRFLFAKLRRKQLADEVPASLAALAYHVAPRDLTVEPGMS